MFNKNAALIILFTNLIVIGFLACSSLAENGRARIENFEQCRQAGYPVSKTLPATCRDPGGMVFTDESQRRSPEALCKDMCGDGKCQEIVCMGSGCPCAESPRICPQDCKGAATR
jgi:hypothetical protein